MFASNTGKWKGGFFVVAFVVVTAAILAGAAVFRWRTRAGVRPVHPARATAQTSRGTDQRALSTLQPREMLRCFDCPVYPALEGFQDLH